MSLWDVDKNSVSRLRPSPNQNDQQGQRLAHNTIGFTQVTESSGDVPYLSVKDGRFQVYRADGTLLFQGGFRDADGDGAVDLAKPGEELT